MISHLNNITISTSYGREALEVLGDSTSGALNKGGIFSKATIISDLNSRMDWITEAAEKYHRIMLDEGGRDFLHAELEIISGWGQSTLTDIQHHKSNGGQTDVEIIREDI